MKHAGFLIVMLALVMVATNCAPAIVPPTEVAAPGQTAAPGTAPVTDWQKKWDDTLAAAKQEGELLIYLNAPSDARAMIPEAFDKAFGIRINVVTGTGAEIATKDG